MIFYTILKRIRGYVLVGCSGGFFAQLVDELVKQGFDIFDIERGDGVGSFYMRASQYKYIRRFAKKNQCRVRVLRKKGYYFAVRKIRFLRPLVAGLAVFFALLFVMGRFVLVVEIKGDNPRSQSEVLASLAEYGVYPGAPRGSIDVPEVEGRLLLEYDEFSWVAVNLSYGRALVEVKPKTEKPQSQTGQPETVIVAARDGIIKNIDVVTGECLVKVGDVVTAGTVLVVPRETTVVNSWTKTVDATILAYTEYTVVFNVERNVSDRVPTGRVVTDRYLRFSSFDAPLFAFGHSYRYFDTLQYSRPVSLFGVNLPVELVTVEYIEVSQNDKILSDLQAEAVFEQQLDRFEKTRFADCRVLSREVKVEYDAATVVYTVTFLCEQDIAVYRTQ